MWVVAADAAVWSEVIEMTAASATNAANSASRTKVLRWRVAMLSRRFELVMASCCSRFGPARTAAFAMTYETRSEIAAVAAASHAAVAAASLCRSTERLELIN